MTVARFPVFMARLCCQIPSVYLPHSERLRRVRHAVTRQLLLQDRHRLGRQLGAARDALVRARPRQGKVLHGIREAIQSQGNNN